MASDEEVAQTLSLDRSFADVLCASDRTALATLVQDYFCSAPTKADNEEEWSGTPTKRLFMTRS